MIANVLILGVGAAGVGEQIIKSLKLQNIHDIKIIGSDINPNSYGRALVDKFYEVPVATSNNYLKVLEDIIEENNINFIFPGSDPDMMFLSKNRNHFHKKNVGLGINSDEVINLCKNKFLTYEALSELDIHIPQYKRILTQEDINDIDFFPLILKPNTGSGGSAGVNIAFDKRETELYVELMLNQGIDIIAQSYEGNKESEFTIGVSASEKGKILGSICLKRDLTSSISLYKKFSKDSTDYVISSGISQGWICHEDNLQSQAEKIAECINSRGPLNVQGREVDGKLLLMEINPRLSGTSYMRALAGYNEPISMLENFLLGSDFDFSYQDMYIGRTIMEKVLD